MTLKSLFVGALVISGLALAPAATQALPFVGEASPVAGYGADDNTELWLPLTQVLAIEIFDVFGGNPGVMSTFGFYRESDPTTLIPIFGPLDQAGVPQQATIDFSLGFVIDDDEAALESVFTPGMSAIGFYMELVTGGGTALLYTQSALNTDFGGVDVFATWQNDIDPDLYLIGAENPLDPTDTVGLRLDLASGLRATTASPIPEPSAALVFMSGLLITGAAIRRRTR
jgi:hypothetical protein